LVAALLVAAAAGCGESRLDRQELLTKANAICASYERRQNEVQVPSVDPTNPATPFRLRAQWGAAINQIALFGRQEVDALRKLSPPEEFERRFQRLLTAKDAAFDGLAETADAAKRNRPQKAKTAGHAAQVKLAKVKTFADALGAKSCA
jgi:hypothetical protein